MLMPDGLTRTSFSNHQILATSSLRAESQLLTSPIENVTISTQQLSLDGSSAGIETPSHLLNQKIHYPPVHDRPQYELSHLKIISAKSSLFPPYFQGKYCSHLSTVTPHPTHRYSFKHFFNIIVQRIDVYFITLKIINN
jgi:hypothetical protein